MVVGLIRPEKSIRDHRMNVLLLLILFPTTFNLLKLHISSKVYF